MKMKICVRIYMSKVLLLLLFKYGKLLFKQQYQTRRDILLSHKFNY